MSICGLHAPNDKIGAGKFSKKYGFFVDLGGVGGFDPQILPPPRPPILKIFTLRLAAPNLVVRCQHVQKMFQ